MKSEDHIDALLRAANTCLPPQPSSALVARVLADAAEFAPQQEAAPPLAKQGILVRMLSPIGGGIGALALAACAAFGVFVGAGYAEELRAVPGLAHVLSALGDDTDSTTPFETLMILMSEG